jgi:ABC-type phosphate/phosphonate transport system substrate-binding protein
MLRDAQIDPTTAFSKQRFYSSHPAVLAALRDHEIDVCGTYLHHSGRLRDDDSADVIGLVPIETSAAIPSDALCLGPHVPPDEVARIEQQLVSDAAVELAATLQAQGFVKRALADYALVRTLLDEEWGRTSNESERNFPGEVACLFLDAKTQRKVRFRSHPEAFAHT